MNHHAIADSLAQRAEASAEMHEDEHAQTLAQLAQAQATLALDDVGRQLLAALRELGPAMAAIGAALLEAALLEADEDEDDDTRYVPVPFTVPDEATR